MIYSVFGEREDKDRVENGTGDWARKTEVRRGRYDPNPAVKERGR